MDFGSIAKKAQDALSDGKAEKLVRDNADKIEDVVEKVGDFAKGKAPGRADQIDAAVGKAKDVIPGGTDGDGKPQAVRDTPPSATATPEVGRTTEAARDVTSRAPSSSGYAPPRRD